MNGWMDAADLLHIFQFTFLRRCHVCVSVFRIMYLLFLLLTVDCAPRQPERRYATNHVRVSDEQAISEWYIWQNNRFVLIDFLFRSPSSVPNGRYDWRSRWGKDNNEKLVLSFNARDSYKLRRWNDIDIGWAQNTHRFNALIKYSGIELIVRTLFVWRWWVSVQLVDESSVRHEVDHRRCAERYLELENSRSETVISNFRFRKIYWRRFEHRQRMWENQWIGDDLMTISKCDGLHMPTIEVNASSSSSGATTATILFSHWPNVFHVRLSAIDRSTHKRPFIPVRHFIITRQRSQCTTYA